MNGVLFSAFLSAGFVFILFWGVQTKAKPPSISSLSPTSGPITALVTIGGSGFGGAQGSNTLWLNGAAVTVLGWSDTALVGAVPSGASSGTFSVTANGQTATS